MRSRYAAVVHDRYGDPAQVLKTTVLPSAALTSSPDQVIVEVTKRPIHLLDLHGVRGMPYIGRPLEIKRDQLRVPGIEGVGRIVDSNTTLAPARPHQIGQRVAFFLSQGAWAEYISVPLSRIVAVPAHISDTVASQMMINTLIAFLLIEAAEDCLPDATLRDRHVILNAAASTVGRILTRVLMNNGATVLRLVRSRSTAEVLERILPGAPIFVTDELEWRVKLRDSIGEAPLEFAFDGVGGGNIEEFAYLLDERGYIFNYGSLGGTIPKISALAQRDIALRSICVSQWPRVSSIRQKAHIDAALQLATREPSLFDPYADLPFLKYADAVAQTPLPGKTGLVLLSSP